MKSEYLEFETVYFGSGWQGAGSGWGLMEFYATDFIALFIKILIR